MTAPVAVGPWRAARLLGGLKARMVRNGLRGSSSRALGFALSAIAATIGALAIGLTGFALLATADAQSLHALSITGAVLFVGAALLPIAFFGVDETFQPQRLVPYGLSPRSRAAGLLAAAAIGPASAGLAAALLIASFGGFRRPTSVVVALMAALGLFLLALVTSRLVTALLAPVLTTRRGADVVLVLASLGGIAAFVAGQLAATNGVTDERLATLAHVTRWVPGGSLSHAASAARAGGPWLGFLVLGWAEVAVLAVVWARVLAHPPAPARRGRQREASSALSTPLFGRALGWLPRDAVGAVAAREARLWWRDPHRRVQVIAALASGLVVPVAQVLGGRAGGAATLTAAAGAGALCAFAAFNLFGFDGRAAWIDLVSGLSARSLLVAKDVGVALGMAPVLVAAPVAVAALGDGWRWLPASFALGLAVLVAGLGGANLVGVRAPWALPEGPNPFAASGNGQGCLSGLLLAGVLLSLFLLGFPVLVLVVWRRRNPAHMAVIGALALGYALVIWAGATRAAARALEGRRPEVLKAVDPTR